MLACRDHANDIGPKGLAQHDGTDGSNPRIRALRYCDKYPGENVSFG